MIFKEYVSELNQFLEDNPELGEMTAVSASDEEGNSYCEVDYSPIAGIYDGEYKGEFVSTDDKEAIKEMTEEGEVINAVQIN